MNRAAWASAVAIGVTACVARGQWHYSVVEITAPPGWRFWPRGMNDRGAVAGEAVPDSGGQRRAAVWRAGVVSFLPSLGGSADAQDINNLGEVVGRSWLGAPSHAVRWDADGVPHDLGVVWGASSQAYGISDTGWITGQSFTASNPDWESPTIYGPSTPTTSLGNTGGRAWGEDVNDHCVVVGTRVQQQGQADYRGWVWDAVDGLRDIPLNPQLRTNAQAINNAGRIVGLCGNDAYIWDPVLGLIIPDPEGWGEAHDVNEAGTVVGRTTALGPFIWDMQRGLRRINDFVSTPIASDFPYALDINNRGQILIIAGNWNTNPLPSRYYLLTPCYTDCDGDGFLSLADFGCFRSRFATNDPYADCNGDTVLNLADFGCFSTKYGLGCP